MPRITHQAHLLRPDQDLWCGGTQPPTEVTVDRRDKEMTVQVYPAAYDPHAGVRQQAESRELFLLPARREITPALIGTYALRALND